MDIAWHKKATGKSVIRLYNLILNEQIKQRERMPQGHCPLHLFVPEERVYKAYMFLVFSPYLRYKHMSQLL